MQNFTTRRAFGALVALIALMTIAVVSHAFAQDEGAATSEPVTLATAKGFVVINAEIARTSKEKEKGLMNRDSLPEGRGMLFVWDQPAPVTMWMRNTRIPLDMIFIGEHGIIHRIVENAVPYSEDFISSHGDVVAVLEVRGGVARKVGLRAGNKVHHSFFDKPAGD